MDGTVFGELSARLIRSNDTAVPPQIVLLNDNLWNTDNSDGVPWAFAWKAVVRILRAPSCSRS